MYKTAEGLRFSPTDITVFLDSEFGSWMDRWYAEQVAAIPTATSSGHSDRAARRSVGPLNSATECCPDEGDKELELIARKGDEHEKTFLADLKTTGLAVVEIPRDTESATKTLASMRVGTALIYQACLEDGNLCGYADFLSRQDGASRLGSYHYEVWDTKLARSPKPYFLVQLCAYADLLERLQGVRPAAVEIVLGTKERRRFVTNHFFYYYRELLRAFLEYHAAFDIRRFPDPGLSSSFGRWAKYAETVLAQADHLSCVARITRNQIRRLSDAGITTMTQLSRCTESYVSGLSSDALERLKRQARLQLESRSRERPLFEVVRPTAEDPRRGLALLPPASPNDIFFDMEGYPLIDGGLEYLFGAVCNDGGELQFVDYWAHDAIQEKRAFEAFIDWAFSRWKADPAMHIYHYAAYEVQAMRKLMGRYATREREVDELLRHEVFVDLYTVVRQGVLVGTSSYSLKDVEKIYLAKRDGGVTTAGGSVVAYQKWLDQPDGDNWQTSKILGEIRDYNRVDCESTWYLAKWLRELQASSAITFISEKEPPAQKTESDQEDTQDKPAKQLGDRLLAEVAAGQVVDSERRRVQELLAWLLEFHWREAKPVWWRMFDRHEMTEPELIDDIDCLGGLRRTMKPSQPLKRSWTYEYKFDPDQDTKLHEGSGCIFAHDLAVKTEIISMNPDGGLLEIKLGPSAPKPPDQLNLIPDEYVSAAKIADAVYRYVEAWSLGTILSQAVDDLLYRRPPRIAGHSTGPIVKEDGESLQSIVDAATRMKTTTLCIQGPPGTGKTYTAAAIIAELLLRKCRVAVTANSHKAILNILKAVVEATEKRSLRANIVKVGDHCDDPMIADGRIRHVNGGADAAGELGADPIVMGGTAWVFCRPELQQQFDYLFVDEAGQFSLANVIATGLAAKNIVLVGDQMQLAQPIQGSHPGESGRSALEYLLQNHATIPPELGVFLDTSWRMHPEICDFISEAVYEKRLHAHRDTAKQQLLCTEGSNGHINRRSGIVFVPVRHECNTQCSDEEVDAIDQIVRELVGRCFIERDGTRRDLTLSDILLVAPYNMQVRRLQKRLGPRAHVGSVDKFQGQEAPVVIVSMCASSADDCPRGIDFLLNKNRINVAISRAKCLAIVVGCPKLMSTRCKTIEQMEMTNLYCWLSAYANGLPA